jgi:hypothetical protein
MLEGKWSYHVGDLGLDVRITLKWTLQIEELDLIHLVQDRAQLQAVVNMRMDMQVP